VQEGTQNSVKKGAHLGPLNEGEHAHETRGAHPALTLASRVNKVGVLKLHSVGQDCFFLQQLSAKTVEVPPIVNMHFKEPVS